MPAVRYNFVPLGELQSVPKDTVCGMCISHERLSKANECTDVIGVVREVGDMTELTSKFNKTVNAYTSCRPFPSDWQIQRRLPSVT
jgi:hypothetical protein